MKNELSNAIRKVPCAIALSTTIATIVILAFGKSEASLTAYLSAAMGAAIAVAITLANDKMRLKIPTAIISLIIAHVVLSTSLGTALGFYDAVPQWDLLMHGLFGFNCSVVTYYLYARFNGRRPSLFDLALIAFVTLGVAALWELYEFTAGGILCEDMQRVQESINAGLSPLFDTMTDIAIAIVGIAGFYISYFADAKTGGKLYGKNQILRTNEARERGE